MQPNDYRSLYDAARSALMNSYSPYSKFRVGAGVLTKSGKVFTGTNVENASYGLTICAERVAIFNAVSQGERDLVAIAVASESEGICTPCGACRQVIYEFANTIAVIYIGASGDLVFRPIHELLPEAFGPKDVSRKLGAL